MENLDPSLKPSAESATASSPEGRVAFIRKVVHDLRNPLASMKMLCDVALMEEGLSGETRAAISGIDEEIRKATQLLETLVRENS